MSKVLFERRLETGLGDGSVIFEHPVPEDEDFACWYEIVLPSDRVRHRAVGVDELQALLLALANARAGITRRLVEKYSYVTWLGQDGLGLLERSADGKRFELAIGL